MAGSAGDTGSGSGAWACVDGDSLSSCNGGHGGNENGKNVELHVYGWVFCLLGLGIEGSWIE